MAELLKNIYSKAFINSLSLAFKKKYSKFDIEEFERSIFNKEWKNKELKERMSHIAICLKEALPNSYEKSISIILKVAPEFGGFEAMFFPDFVEKFGTDKENIQTSLLALEELTKYSSSEFAIRPFIIASPNTLMKLLFKWSKNKNHHIRRLASEGCRPRLPWAMALPEFKKDPKLILPILENMKNDSEDYVRKSVANNLNDISKDHPKLVLKLAKSWFGHSKNTDWIIKHALRTLLKAGNEEAMKLFGFLAPTAVKVKFIKAKASKIEIGQSGSFSFSFEMKTQGKIRLEYGIDYMKKNGSHNRKVFKISEKMYEKGIYEVDRNHSFRQMSTRKHYVGRHYISLIINGIEMKRESFELV